MKRTVVSRTAGFTLVELVMVIILIGVLSALGIGLFAGRSAFSPLLATQQLASATLFAQQAALAGNSANTLTIEQDGGDFRFTVGGGSSNPRVFELPREGTTLSVAGGPPLTLTFNISGSPPSLTVNANGAPVASNGLNLTFLGDSTYQTCLSSLGAVYAGSCQP